MNRLMMRTTRFKSGCLKINNNQLLNLKLLHNKEIRGTSLQIHLVLP